MHWSEFKFQKQSFRDYSLNKLFQNFRKIKRGKLFLLKTNTVTYSDVLLAWGVITRD